MPVNRIVIIAISNLYESIRIISPFFIVPLIEIASLIILEPRQMLATTKRQRGHIFFFRHSLFYIPPFIKVQIVSGLPLKSSGGSSARTKPFTKKKNDVPQGEADHPRVCFLPSAFAPLFAKSRQKNK